jgi:hypothetical protein
MCIKSTPWLDFPYSFGVRTEPPSVAGLGFFSCPRKYFVTLIGKPFMTEAKETRQVGVVCMLFSQSGRRTASRRVPRSILCGQALHGQPARLPVSSLRPSVEKLIGGSDRSS